MWQQFLQTILEDLINASPLFFWAGVVLIVGLVFAKWMGDLTASFLGRVKLNNILKRLGAEDVLLKIDTNLNAPKFFSEIVKWFFVILTLMASSDIIGLKQLSSFFEKVIVYFPNIFVAAVIFMVAAFLSDFSQKIVIGTLERERITYSRFMGKTVNWIIWLFAILAILYQLRITPSLILAVFIGMVATMSIALGVAFGLGGKDLASRFLKELEDKFK